MHSRRILLAFSMATSAASVTFADLVQLEPITPNKPASQDRLEELTKSYNLSTTNSVDQELNTINKPTSVERPVVELSKSNVKLTSSDLREVQTKSTKPATTATPDRLEELTKTLAKGSYTHPSDMDIPAETQLNVTIRKSYPVEFNNASLDKYLSNNATTNTNTSKNNADVFKANGTYSWLVTHPLPDMKRVSSNFGGRTMGGRAENHSGLDLSATSGTPIYATGPGVVTKSGWGRGYGQYVEINHGNGFITRYAHASRLIARVGDRVQAGEHIANVGCTGRCTGPHLHYEVVKDGQRKNPSTYLAMLP